MAGQPEHMSEGIRFLDESPGPGPGPGSAPLTPPPAPPGRPKKKEWPVGVIAFLAVVAGGIFWKLGQEEVPAVREVFEEQIRVEQAAPRIEIEALQGSVRVHRGADQVVRYRVEAIGKGPTVEEAARSVNLRRPILRSLPDGISLRVGGIEAQSHDPEHVKISVEVPGDAQVRVVTGRGSVRVKNIRGSIAAKTTVGKIEVEGAEGPIVLETKNGSIDCEAHNALVLATTVNGSIEFEGSLAPGTSRMVTSNGSVKLELPASNPVVVDARAGNGKVSSDFPIERAELGSGLIPISLVDEGPIAHTTRVEIRTSNGSIRVEKD